MCAVYSVVIGIGKAGRCESLVGLARAQLVDEWYDELGVRRVSVSQDAAFRRELLRACYGPIFHVRRLIPDTSLAPSAPAPSSTPAFWSPTADAGTASGHSRSDTIDHI